MHDLDYFQNWLNHYSNLERNPDSRLFRLETTEQLAGIFHHPELEYKTYHVTGSKGKGSLSKMLACILAEIHGSDIVGIYGSPHVYDFRERVGKADGFFADSIYNRTITEFIQTVDSLPDAAMHSSWFELNAAFAFLLFKNVGCQHAVFEVGMGGRLDATNIIRPEISCITEIELEHTKFLGNTLEKIATEKAGIIKADTPVVVSAQKTASVRSILQEAATKQHAPIYFVDKLGSINNLHYENKRLCFEAESKLFSRPLHVKLKMLNRVQALNALQAAITIKILYPHLSETIIERGLSKVTLPGRFEIRDNIVLDGAHTVESISECISTFCELYPTHPRNLLFAISEDKNVKNIAPLFKNHFDNIFITRPGDFKKSNLLATEAAFTAAGITAIANDNYQELIKTALRASLGIPLFVTGSFYLLDEVNKILGL